MSLGFIPVIISILLGEFITNDMSVYIGAGVGVIECACLFLCRKSLIPPLILYATTGMLVLMSAFIFFTGSSNPPQSAPFILEISALVSPAVILLLHRRHRSSAPDKPRNKYKQLLTQGIEAAVVTSRVVLLTGLLHFLAIGCTLLFRSPLSDTARLILFHIVPPAVFVVSILFNQLGICYFNTIMKHTRFLPIVNIQGKILGKMPVAELIRKKNKFICPVVRIAVASQGMLFLASRPQCCLLEKGRMDLPMETFLTYGESLKQGAERILKQTFPAIAPDKLRFSLKYHFKNQVTNRLIFLFLLDIEDDTLLYSAGLKNAKLWTFQQIKYDIGHNYFSSCFENEYEYLKSVICTREKYKGL